MSSHRSGRPTRLKLLIAYDGAPFRGWQSQTGGNTVQDHLEAAFFTICGTQVRVHGAGRTDAGVHALAQCAHADVSRSLSDWPGALNANLPREIRIIRCSRAAGDFHARFSATGKTYIYRIWSAPVHSPFELGRSWHMPVALDVKTLRAAAEKLCGTHDFASFAANRGKPVTDTVRTISTITVQRRGPRISVRYTGDGFLYKMVRLITGSLVRCATGREELQWLDKLLAREFKTHYAAPAEGLYLARVHYSGLITTA